MTSAPVPAITPFPLGVYLGNPDGSDPAAEAQFEANYTQFTALMGAAPQFIDSFIDYTQPVSDWTSNAGWQAWSNAQSSDARGLTPVIALPMYSIAASAPSPDQQFKAFASGQYDSVLQGIVAAWAGQGFTTLVFRPGWEFNLKGPGYVGSDAQSQADWIAAFQHIYTVLHAAGVADNVNVSVVWNPGVTNYSNAEATAQLYPGNAYVDVIGADIYSDIYPYSDGNNAAGQPTYHDWATGQEDTSVAQFIANPINREHYWTYPAATEWSLDGSGGHSQSLQSLIQFALQQGKPFAIPETGAGNTGVDVTDDAAFPQWLAGELNAAQSQGLAIDFVNLWDSNGGGAYAFSDPSDGKPQEAAAWAQYFGAQSGPQTIGSGPDAITLWVSEDAWLGDAQFTVSVNGQQIGSTEVTTASQVAGQEQAFIVQGSFAPGPLNVAVDFTNAADGGTPSTDRSLYVNSIVVGSETDIENAELYSDGTRSFRVGTTLPVNIGTGPAAITLAVAEDAWLGDAQFTVAVDGLEIGGVQTATASHAQGAEQDFILHGEFGAGRHVISVDFINHASGGTPQTERNLYVNSIAQGGTTTEINAALLTDGRRSFRIGTKYAKITAANVSGKAVHFLGTASSTGSPKPDTAAPVPPTAPELPPPLPEGYASLQPETSLPAFAVPGVIYPDQLATLPRPP